MSKCDQDAAGNRSAAVGCDSRFAVGVGQWLQSRREAMGVSVTDLARALKLQGFYIDALEGENFECLPARTYAVGYVRSMAQALSLDPDEAATRLRIAWPDGDRHRPDAAPPSFSVAPVGRRFPASAILSLAFVVAIAAYAYWYATKSADMGRPLLSPVAELEATAPPVLEAPQPAPGPLRLLGVPELSQSADAPGALGHAAEPAGADKLPLPSPHLPRPRPGTVAATVFAATYLLPVTTDDSFVAPHGTLVADAGLQADSLPARTSLAAYLPAVRLRTDLGPLRTGTELPAVLQIARHGPAALDDVAFVSPVGRTQAFAAVPPVAGSPMAGNRRGADARPPASYDAITALTRAADPDETNLPAITILADQLCWVELRASGKALAQRLLHPGDRMDVPARRGVTLTAGNAGGIRILVDGVTAPALGGVGQVVRGVSLVPHELLSRR